MFVFARPKESGALGSADPFVQIAGVIGGPEFSENQRQHPGSMRPIDQSFHAARLEFANDFCDRKNQGRIAGDVIDHGKTGAASYDPHNRFNHFISMLQRKGDACDNQPGPGASSDLCERVVAGIVIVVGGEQLIAPTEIQRANDGIDCSGCVGGEHQVASASADEFREFNTGRFEPFLVATP